MSKHIETRHNMATATVSARVARSTRVGRFHGRDAVRVAHSRASASDDDAHSSAHRSFLGDWLRDPQRNQHVVAYLVAHGVGVTAVDRSRERYAQTWCSSDSGVDGEFTVRTTSASGTDRTLTYVLSEDGFVESYKTSQIFGKEPGQVRRFAAFDAKTGTHEVRTESSLGRETTTRTVSEDRTEMTCVRRFISNDPNHDIDITATERFVRPSA